MDERTLTRFWAKVAKSDSPNECWLWTATPNRDGYGRIGVGGRKGAMILAHRFSYELHIGPIPEGLCVLHECDNPPCVNPAHLWIGTQIQNLADMTAKGRRPRGVAHGNAKLTDDDVRAIRESDETQPVLAARYGVSQPHISNVRTGKRRAH